MRKRKRENEEEENLIFVLCEIKPDLVMRAAHLQGEEGRKGEEGGKGEVTKVRRVGRVIMVSRLSKVHRVLGVTRAYHLHNRAIAVNQQVGLLRSGQRSTRRVQHGLSGLCGAALSQGSSKRL